MFSNKRLTCLKSKYLSLFLSFILWYKIVSSDTIAPVFTPETNETHSKYFDLGNQMMRNQRTADIMIPVLTLNSASSLVAGNAIDTSQHNVASNQRNNTSPVNKSSRRKRKNQSNKQYKPNSLKIDSRISNTEANENGQGSLKDNALLMQLTNKQLGLSEGSSANSADQGLQFVPVFTNQQQSQQPHHHQPNQHHLHGQNTAEENAVAQHYLKHLTQQLVQKSAQQDRSQKLQKRVHDNLNAYYTGNGSPDLANLNPLMANLPSSVYNVPQPYLLSLQPAMQEYAGLNGLKDYASFAGPGEPATNSLAETGDKIFSRIKQWSNEMFSSKSGLNRQINEVLNVVSDLAMVTLVGVPLVGLLSFGLPSLMQSSFTMPSPFSIRKSFSSDGKTSKNTASEKKQHTKAKTSKAEEKKEKSEEKQAKSEETGEKLKRSASSNGRTKVITILERAGQELGHVRSLMEIAKNFELAFKKYSINEKECKQRILCELSNEQFVRGKETAETAKPGSLADANSKFLSSNGLKEERRMRRHVDGKKDEVANHLVEQLVLDDIQTRTGGKQTLRPVASNYLYQVNENVKNELLSVEKDLNLVKSKDGQPLNGIFKVLAENKALFSSILPRFEKMMKALNFDGQNLLSKMLGHQEKRINMRADELFKQIMHRGHAFQDKIKDLLHNFNVFSHLQAQESKKKARNGQFRMKRAFLVQNSAVHNEEKQVDVSGLKYILTELLAQQKALQSQENQYLPLSKLWLNNYLSAYESGAKHVECKVKYAKCNQSYFGLNNEQLKRSDLEIIHNNHKKTFSNQEAKNVRLEAFGTAKATGFTAGQIMHKAKK